MTKLPLAAQEVPKQITPDQYDKLMRKLWELEQRMRQYDATIINSTSMDALFEQQRVILNELKAWRKSAPKLLAALVRLMRKEN